MAGRALSSIKVIKHKKWKKFEKKSWQNFVLGL
jgi:hypothetical protein